MNLFNNRSPQKKERQNHQQINYFGISPQATYTRTAIPTETGALNMPFAYSSFMGLILASVGLGSLLVAFSEKTVFNIFGWTGISSITSRVFIKNSNFNSSRHFM